MYRPSEDWPTVTPVHSGEDIINLIFLWFEKVYLSLVQRCVFVLVVSPTYSIYVGEDKHESECI